MWAKILVLIAVTTAGVRINGLQNDLDIGYSYDHPHSLSSTVQASLAYYVNIPASRDARQHFYVISAADSGRYMPPARQFGRIPSRDFGGNFANHGIRQFSPEHSQALSPNHNVNRLNYPRGPVLLSDSLQQFRHQTDPRSSARNAHQGGGYIIHRSIVEHVQQNNFNNFADQAYQRSPTRSEEVIPQPYAPHVTVQFEPKTRQLPAQKQYRLVTSMASLPMSYDAQLPFPIGAVPIKFRPLPLKTHLRQGLLLPITSYQARDTYMK